MEIALLLGLGLLALYAASNAAPAPTSARTRLPSGAPGRYFSWEELTRSATASRLHLDNTPTPEAQQRLKILVENLLDPLREKLGPINIHDGYRSKVLNSHIRGASSTSQHMLGEAVDFDVPGMTAREVAIAIIQSGLPFDQLIWYAPSRGGHVHVSLTSRRPNRRDTRYAPPNTEEEIPWSP